MKPVPSPFTPVTYPDMPAIAGVQMATIEAGIRYKGRQDLLLMSFVPHTQVAGVFTLSGTAGPPVQWCRDKLNGGEIRALVVNSGNANVFTGTQGHMVVSDTAAAAASALDIKADSVFVSSTGVIGELPPVDRLTRGVVAAVPQLGHDKWHDAARAIMTTDTFPKMATLTFEIDGATVTLNGIAKGSGMIAPNMATMLVYLATDANTSHTALQSILSKAVHTTFNAITVDSDTSTSDTLLVAATGMAKHARIERTGDPGYDALYDAIYDMCRDLAHQVIKDGEGVTKFAEIEVTGAQDEISAKTIAMSIANSPLVKTAIAGSDPNWGRIMMAIGKTPVPIDQNALKLWICGIPVAANGALVPGYDEAPVAEKMAKPEISIKVDLGEGNVRFTAWTSDLTHGYIDVNVDYRS